LELTHNQALLAIAAELASLDAEPDAPPGSAKQKAKQEAIGRLEYRRAQLNVLAADQIGAEVDRLLAELEEIRNRHPLDAVSALTRTIDGLRDRVEAIRGQ
jgi:hypothetical protein